MHPSAPVVLLHLGAAYRAAQQIGDPALCGYLLALARRVQNPVAPSAEPGSRNAAIARQRQQMQTANWPIAVAMIDAWMQNRDDHTPFTDICREVYRLGIGAGVNSIVPEWAEQFHDHPVDLSAA